MADQRILFRKSSTAKYISHLDLMHTMERAFLRAGIAIRHTEGYHPHPYVSIPLPLPLGFSSDCEILEFGLLSGSAMETLPGQMNRVLPDGIQILCCYEGGLPFKKLTFVRYKLTLEFSSAQAEEAAADFRALMDRAQYVVQKKSKKAKHGFIEVDIIPLVEDVEEIRPDGTLLHLTLLLRAQNPGLNPGLLLQGFQAAYPELDVIYAALHRQEILDAEKQVYR